MCRHWPQHEPGVQLDDQREGSSFPVFLAGVTDLSILDRLGGAFSHRPSVQLEVLRALTLFRPNADPYLTPSLPQRSSHRIAVENPCPQTISRSTLLYRSSRCRIRNKALLGPIRMRPITTSVVFSRVKATEATTGRLPPAITDVTSTPSAVQTPGTRSPRFPSSMCPRPSHKAFRSALLRCRNITYRLRCTTVAALPYQHYLTYTPLASIARVLTLNINILTCRLTRIVTGSPLPPLSASTHLNKGCLRGSRDHQYPEESVW